MPSAGLPARSVSMQRSIQGLEGYCHPVARLHEGYAAPVKGVSSVAGNRQSDQRNCVFVCPGLGSACPALSEVC